MSLFILTIIEFLIGSAFHFGNDVMSNPVATILFPINESIFEHVKLIYYPMIIGSVAYSIYKPKGFITLTSSFVGNVSAMILMLLLYYFYRYGLGIESLFVDIGCLFVVIGLGNLLGWIVVKHHFEVKNSIIYLLYVVIFLFIAYSSFYPWDIPMFIPKNPVT